MSSRQIKSFRDLDVWRLGMDLVVETYRVVSALPRSELYELSGQIRRAVMSIPSNVAGGHTRRGRAYRNHVRIALGSSAELETQIEAAIRLGFVTANDAAALFQMNTRVAQMLHRLSGSLRRDNWTIGSSFAFLACATGAALFHVFG